MSEGEHRVLKFRPRTHARQPAARPSDPLAPDLSRFDRAGESPDEYRHRMIANVAAFAFTAALTGIGIWLATTLAGLRNAQDCVLMGGGIARISRHRPAMRFATISREKRPSFRPAAPLNSGHRSDIRGFNPSEGIAVPVMRPRPTPRNGI
jgi:hypothetical protein